MAGRLYWLLGVWAGGSNAARCRMQCLRRRSRSRGARLSAGETEACGSRPPRRSTAIFLRINPVVLGFATMDGFPREGMPEDAGHPCPLTHVSEPVPRAHTFDRDDNSLPRGGNDLEESLGACREVLMHQDLPIMVQDAEVHRPGVE